MLRQMSCVVILTAAAASSCAADASTTQPDASGAGASIFRADHSGVLWSQAVRTEVAGGSIVARARAARTAVFRGHDRDRGSSGNAPYLVLEAGDQREEYEGLLTDAILRLIKDLRPLLARR